MWEDILKCELCTGRVGFTENASLKTIFATVEYKLGINYGKRNTVLCELVNTARCLCYPMMLRIPIIFFSKSVPTFHCSKVAFFGRTPLERKH